MKIFASLILCFSLNSFADSNRKFLSPFHLAYGNAGVASVQADLSYIMNPATLSFYHQSQVSGAYYSNEKELGKILKKTLVSFVDKSSILPMGVTYERDFTDDLTNASKEKWEGSASVLFQRFLSLGASIQKIKESDEDSHSLELKAGGILKLKPNLHFGLVIENLKAYAESSKNRPNLRLGLHHRWSYRLNTRADINYEKMKMSSVNLGTEFFVKQFVALRFGGEWIPSSSKKEKDDLFFGFGIGLTSPRLRVDLAYSTPSIIKTKSILNFKHYVIMTSLAF